jgi:hypothetical protein
MPPSTAQADTPAGRRVCAHADDGKPAHILQPGETCNRTEEVMPSESQLLQRSSSSADSGLRIDLPAPATQAGQPIPGDRPTARGGELHRSQTDEVPPDVTVVSGTMSRGHYSKPADAVTSHDVRFVAKLAFTGPSAVQRAYICAECHTCHQTRDIGTLRTLADVVRWYAQHAGKAAVVLELASILKAIGDDGQDVAS